MFDYYCDAVCKYAEFNGRARRKEYWYFVLCNMIIAGALGFLGGVTGNGTIFSNLYTIGLFIPSIAVGVRRLHDTGRSGWWIMLPIINIFFLVQDSKQGANAYGANPKGT